MSEMSDLEYAESGQAKQDLYDELMKLRAEVERLKAALTAVMDDDTFDLPVSLCKIIQDALNGTERAGD